MHRKLKPELKTAASAALRHNSTAAAEDSAPAYQFVPMWDVQKEAITNYRCETIAGPNAFESLSPSAKFKADGAAADGSHGQRIDRVPEKSGAGEANGTPDSRRPLPAPSCLEWQTKICPIVFHYRIEVLPEADMAKPPRKDASQLRAEFLGASRADDGLKGSFTVRA